MYKKYRFSDIKKIQNKLVKRRLMDDNSLNCMRTTFPMYLRTPVLLGVGLSGCRTIGPSDYRAVGLSGRRNIRRSPCHSPSVRVGVCALTKTLTLAITFLPEVIGLSYCTCVFLVTRPFTWYHNFLASGTNVRGANVIALVSASASALAAWTKTLTLVITFKPEEIGLSYCTCVFLVTRPFTWYHKF